MGKGISALANLPKANIILPDANAALSVESLKALAFKVASMQSEGIADGTYNGQVAVGADPYFSSVWNITVAASGVNFTCVFVSDSNVPEDAVGRAALSGRRKIDVVKLTSANLASVRSLLAAINFILC